jgi:hypothetical protein
MKKYNTRIAVPDRQGCMKLRIHHRKRMGNKCPRFLVKCGDCHSSLEIYYDEDGMEINGVNASLKEWRSLLLPLLRDKLGR